MGRYTVEFPSSVEKILKKYAAIKDIDKAEIIREALGLYDYVMSNVDGKETTLNICVEKDGDRVPTKELMVNG